METSWKESIGFDIRLHPTQLIGCDDEHILRPHLEYGTIAGAKLLLHEAGIQVLDDGTFYRTLLGTAPSLRRTIPEVLRVRYHRAREDTSDQTPLPLATFPEHCPWTVEQVLDEDFFSETTP